MKKSVALYVAIVFVLLSGVCYSDEFEYLQNPSKTGIHQVTSSTDNDPFISDEYPGVPGSTVLLGASMVDHHLIPVFTHSIHLISLRNMPSRETKLLLLLSTFRI